MTPPPADEVRRAAAAVFERPEFARADAKAWLSKLLEPVADFFQWLGSLSEASPTLFWVIFVGLLVALALMLALIAYQVRAAFSVGGDARRKAERDAAKRAKVSAQYRDESDRRAAAGDYTEAVRYLFLALVYRLDERGRVGFRKAYTNREYLALIGDRLPSPDALAVVVDTLDDHWYGQRPCDRPRYEECRAVADRLMAA